MLRPHDERTIQVLLEPQAGTGTFYKQIRVMTDEPGNPDHTFTVEARFPRARGPGRAGPPLAAAVRRPDAMVQPRERYAP